MAKRILHLRGTREEYERYGVTVGDGELALERREGAPTRIKIGNGRSAYADLPYFGKNIRRIRPPSSDHARIELSHGDTLVCELHSSYELLLPERIDEDYACELLLYTSIRPPAITYPSTLVFFGDHCEGGLFHPEARMLYMISLTLCDGTVYATVKGAPLTLAYESYSEIVEEVLPYTATVFSRDAKNILDISLGGYFGGGDTDGYVGGLGNYNYDVEKYEIAFDSRNAHLMDFTEFEKGAIQYKNKLTYKSTDEGFSVVVKPSMLTSIFVSNMLRPSQNTRYRIKIRLRVLSGMDPVSAGASVESPFTISYSDQSSEKLNMTAQEDGTFFVDYLTAENKNWVVIYYSSMGDAPVGVEILERDFAIYASFDGIEPPVAPAYKMNTIFLDEPLLAASDVRDTISLSSMTLTRRVCGELLYDFDIHSTSGDYTVFYFDISVPMAKDGTFVMEDFSRIENLESLQYTPYSYVVDSQIGRVYFTGGEDQTDRESMNDYIFFDLESTSYVYERETPIIETLDAEIDFRHYENYMVLRYIMEYQGNFIIKKYTEKEEAAYVRQVDTP